ncbi:aldo/keto reductase [Orbus wheelerorum]|uniref:aldo/keto reductase n=1 Tax=Orbus wheelerorum TaxID=3074111 RepID=UPI00370DA655
MQYRQLGQTNEKISAIGLGCMGMSHAYGDRDEAQSLNTLQCALDLGINFWDTADFYGDGENEKLIAKVLKPNRDKIFIATKFGFKYQNNNGDFGSKFDGSPAWMRQAIDLSLKRLQVECIDLYYMHRVDQNVPIEESVGAMADLVKEGKVRYLGLSEASSESLKRANKVHPIAALRSEYSLLTRGIEPEILPTVRELGMTLVPYSPLGRGMFSENFDISQFEADDLRFRLPRFQGEHLINNQKLMQALTEFAHGKSLTTAQLALAWLLHQGQDIVPIPGTKKIKYLQQNAQAVDAKLTLAEIAEIDAIIRTYPNTGERYTADALKLVNH